MCLIIKHCVNKGLCSTLKRKGKESHSEILSQTARFSEKIPSGWPVEAKRYILILLTIYINLILLHNLNFILTK